MNNRVRLGGAVAAIAVIVVLGLVLIPRPAGNASATHTTPPAASPSPTALPTSVVAPGVIPPGRLCSATDCLGGTLEAGTYSLDAGYSAPTKVTFAVPAGWTSDGGTVGKNMNLGEDGIDPAANEVVFMTFLVTHVYTDACHWASTMVSAGSTVDQLASLLVTQKGRITTAPTKVTISGFPAERIESTMPSKIDMSNCDSARFQIWPDPAGTEPGGLSGGSPGSTDVVYLMNVTGPTFVILARHGPKASSADLAELNAVIASIKIAAPSASPAPSGASPSP